MVCQLWRQYWFTAGIYLPLCSSLRCSNTDVCGYVVNQTRELVQHLKTFSLTISQVQSQQPAAVLASSVGQSGRSGKKHGIARTGIAIGAAYHDTAPWQVSAGVFLAGCCWPSFTGIKSYLERNMQSVLDREWLFLEIRGILDMTCLGSQPFKQLQWG